MQKSIKKCREVQRNAENHKEMQRDIKKNRSKKECREV
jgi:hypothetical protein